jgi:phosphatidylinositol alpha-1,6-mannosyltransferase
MCGRSWAGRVLSNGRVAKLLLVLTEFPPSVGGMQTHAIHTARYLCELGHDIEVVTYRSRREESAQFDAGLSFPVHRLLSRVSYFDNLRLVEARLRGVDAIYASTVFFGMLGDRVPVFCRSAGNDILRPWIAYPFERGSRLLASPWVDDILYDSFMRWKRPELVYSWFHDARFELMRRALAGNSHVFANSEFTAELLRNNGFERYTVVPGGVAAEEFRPRRSQKRKRRKQDDFVFLTACRLVAKKGIEVLLEAAGLVLQDRPRTKFVIVGDGPRREAMEALAKPLGDRVVFTGRVPHHEMKRQYWSSDCFVLASRDHVHPRTGLRDVETMGRVLCEANAAGLPVIGSNTGGIPSVVTHGYNGLLFEPGNPEALAEQMLFLANTPRAAGRLASNGLDRARREFDWSVVLDRQVAVMIEALTFSAARSRAFSH